MDRKRIVLICACVIMLLSVCACGSQNGANSMPPAAQGGAQTAEPSLEGEIDANKEPHSLESNLDQLMTENENLQQERDVISEILWDDALRTQSERRMVYVVDAGMEGDRLSVTLQTVLWLTGDEAVKAVMEDSGLSEEQAKMETEGGYYIQETDQKETFTVREGAIFYMEEPFSRMQMEGSEFLLWWGDENEPWQKQLPYQALINHGQVVLLQSFYLP